MAFGKKSSRRSSSSSPAPRGDAKKGKTGKKETKLVAALHWKRPLRSLLRSYPDSSGCMIATRAGVSVRKRLSPAEFRQTLTHEASELANRPPMGLNLLGATLHAGLEVLPVLPDGIKDLGLDHLKAVLDKEEVKQAALHMQKGAEGATPDKIEKAIQLVLGLLQGPEDGKDDLGKSLCKLVDGTSRLYAMAVSLLEAKALVGKQTDWAHKVPLKGLQAPSLRKWVDSPDVSTLAKATAQAYQKSWYWSKTSQKRKFGEDVDSEATPPPGSDDDADKNKKAKDKKTKKTKKGKNKSSSSTSSSSSSSDKKAKKSKAKSSKGDDEQDKKKKKEDAKKLAEDKAKFMEKLLEEEEAAKSVFGDWGAEEITSLASLVDAWSKAEAPTVDDLKTMVGMLPKGVAEHYGMTQTVNKVGAFSKLPSKAVTDAIIKEVASIAAAAQASLPAAE